jgi:acetyltransferase-like isoleucine patch superfamily enzyme
MIEYYYAKALKADIGSYCSIANHCIIGMGAHPWEWVGTSPAFYEGRESIKLKLSEHPREAIKRVSIGHDVWIGTRSLIHTCARIGTGAVVGMGSIVTGDVEPYMIVAGNPAKPIRCRFSDTLVERRLRSQWWTLDERALAAAAVHARDPEAFLGSLGL